MAEKNELAVINAALSEVEITPATLETTDFADNYAKMMFYLQQLQDLKSAVDAKIKETLEADYLVSGNQTVSNGKYSYTYKPETTRESVDTARLKTENPELYKSYVKVSNVKSSVTVKEIKVKEGK